ncbi:MutS domain V [Desulfacinum hydrothermale DSM 13146]|uniref:MutS domain V n=1 Tax=Desulfacinum hydrothermale DSM 13146 TaxID=1121390 RepID=A0A1W1XJJ9_9BACT|nr:hypothetical protein [Desulfacinum hydrothermale]SMC23977.1 MutS domain V [Desulfacinum hydrothermale DSM 13146]
MKVWLLYPDRDFDPNQPLPPHVDDLVQDLELNTLFKTMALGDRFVFDVVRRVVLLGLEDVECIRYRQNILRDCLKNAQVVRQIYELPIQALASKRRLWLGMFGKYPSSILSGARGMLKVYLELLKSLRKAADTHADQFESEGFRRFFGMIHEELNDEYLATVEHHLKVLEFNGGTLVSAELGRGNEGTNYVLRKPKEEDRNWLERILFKRSSAYSYTLHPRDDQGARALGRLRDRSLNQAANAVAQAAEHVENFFKVMRRELAFYIGCLNLAAALHRLHAPMTFPEPAPPAERRLSAQGLYDATLALTMQRKAVSNDMAADGKDLLIITGANQGGKTTFLRSVGLAQVMMQCGLFVPARSFSANLCRGLFSHFKREEDASMKSGKLEEEVVRMSTIVDALKPHAMVLFNESFAATNEHEGSEIARQVVRALLERSVKVLFVTHLHAFARGFFDKQTKNILFLRAERRPDGTRTFKLFQGAPLSTSYGPDLYQRIFGTPKVPDNEQETLRTRNGSRLHR